MLASVGTCAALLVERCPAARQVVLFDSCPNGWSTPSSDADILIVIEDDHRAARASVVDAARHVVLHAPVPVDIRLATPAQLEAGTGVAAALRNGSIQLA